MKLAISPISLSDETQRSTPTTRGSWQPFSNLLLRMNLERWLRLFWGCFFDLFCLFLGPAPSPVYLMQKVSWLLHFNFSTCASNLLSRLHISFYIEAKRRRMASCVLCVAVAFFYPSENIIFNNIYNNDIIINKEMFMYGTLLPVDIFCSDRHRRLMPIFSQTKMKTQSSHSCSYFSVFRRLLNFC